MNRVGEEGGIGKGRGKGKRMWRGSIITKLKRDINLSPANVGEEKTEMGGGEATLKGALSPRPLE